MNSIWFLTWIIFYTCITCEFFLSISVKINISTKNLFKRIAKELITSKSINEIKYIELLVFDSWLIWQRHFFAMSLIHKLIPNTFDQISLRFSHLSISFHFWKLSFIAYIYLNLSKFEYRLIDVIFVYLFVVLNRVFR